MSHLDKVKLRRRRARGFLARALDSVRSGDYDLAAFISERTVQLHFKSILLAKVGDYHRTHSITLLISILKKVCGEDYIKFFEGWESEISLMEDAYIASRYLVREFSREEAERPINFAKEVLKLGEVS